MAKIDIMDGFGTIVLARNPPWARKKYCLKSIARGPPSLAQKRVQLDLVRNAISARGTTGQMGVAMKVQSGMKKGSGVYGGMTAGQRQKRNWAKADSTLHRLESETK